MQNQDCLTQLVQDAQRFIMYHKGVIESYPLQTYISALLFSPTGSLVRQQFQHEEPKGITVSPAMSDSWSACLQTLEGHSSQVTSVAFSHDSARLASASWDNTVKIWDARSGACLQTLQISKHLENVSFDSTGSFLHTAIGTIALQSAEGSSMTDVTESEQPLNVAISLSPDSIWIKHNSENLLWVPSEYRPSRSSVSETTIGASNGSGRVWFCRINV
jgi:WD40 repeat protein